MTAQLETQPGYQNSLVLAWSLTKEQLKGDPWSLPGANPSSGSEQTEVVVTARAMGDTCCQVSSALLVERHIKVAINGYVEG